MHERAIAETPAPEGKASKGRLFELALEIQQSGKVPHRHGELIKTAELIATMPEGAGRKTKTIARLIRDAVPDFNRRS
jgi:hypothetical protein